MSDPFLDRLEAVMKRATAEMVTWPVEIHPIILADSIEAYHSHIPLDLTALMVMPNIPFRNDCIGINQRYNRKRDRIIGRWRPNCAKEKHHG